ncbi:MFS transporter [Neptunicoccus cionae]|uniref:MFS transporter n=1 Tax=Neptunicoccus cionae TaxID=2035344 RepID=UPI000C776E47|nr:MFS transporter [Amylibacter cionae]PLS22786.1 MFS transporter [Amylibacter cionae]
MTTFQFIRDNFRWLAAGVLLTFLSSFGQTYFISIFAGEIQSAFDLSHGDWGGIYFLGTMVSGMLMIWAGSSADHFRVRVLAVVVMTTLAVLSIAMSRISTVWLLPVLVFGLRFTGQGMLSHIAVVAMARWFVRARGKAISYAGLGFALGQAILPVVFVALMLHFHWQSLWLISAGFLLLCIPLLLWLLKSERVPSDVSMSSDATGMSGRHWTRKEVLSDWRFWGLIPIATLSSTFGTALFFQQVHLAEVKGWSHVELVALFPIYTATLVVSGLLGGWAVDRWGSVRLLAFSQIPMAIGFVMLGTSGSLLVAAFAFAIIGVGGGAYATIGASFWPEVYGTRSIGSIKALATALMVFGSAIGPAFTGWGIDLGVNFPDQMVAYAVYMVLVSLWTAYVARRIRAGFTATVAA